MSEQEERSRGGVMADGDLLEAIVETNPVGIAVVDESGELTFANERAEEIYGRTRDEIADFSHDDPRWDLVDENGDPLDDGETPFDRVVDGGEAIYDQVIGLRRPSGERVWVSVNGAPNWNEDGDLERAVFAFEDVTERRELKAEIEEHLGRVTDAFYALDEEFRFTHVNERAEELLQASADELLGEVLWEQFPEAAEVDEVWNAFHTAVETQDAQSYELYYDPLEFWVEATVYPSETGVSVYFQDVTERMERERELERALDLLERTERIADVGGWEIDPETADVFWSDHIFELLEVDAEEEPPLEDALDMYVAEDQPRVEAAVEEALDSGNPFDIEVRIRTAGGEVRWLRLQGVPETDDSELVSFRGAAQDVTEHKERERQLEKLVEQLEESNERLEQFAYAASHDLQEPLRMVSSYLQLVERRYADELDEDAEEFIEFAVDGAERMREMIEGLLEYSRIKDQGGSFETVELDELLESVFDDLRLRIEESDAEITSDELPTVKGDDDQLRQLFQNLLSNAIEYSGDEPPRVHISAERDGPRWLISVADEGIGIDPDEADRVFDVFERLHTRDEHAGTGIGLAVCERIVEHHDGEIWVDSEPGEGATFSFTLPAAEPPR